MEIILEWWEDVVNHIVWFADQRDLFNVIDFVSIRLLRRIFEASNDNMTYEMRYYIREKLCSLGIVFVTNPCMTLSAYLTYFGITTEDF